MRSDMVTDPIAHHGEGVIWDTSAGKLRWVDMLAGDVLSMAPREHEPDRLDVGAVATAIRPRRAGGLPTWRSGDCLARSGEIQR
jgi:sugar lactone lactonase YvrE